MATNNGMSGVSKESLFDAYGATKRKLMAMKARNREQLARVTQSGGSVAGGLVAGALEQRLRDRRTGQTRTLMGVGLPLVVGTVATGLGMTRQAGKFSELSLALGNGMLAYGVGNITRDRLRAADDAKARKAQQASGGAVVAGYGVGGGRGHHPLPHAHHQHHQHAGAYHHHHQHAPAAVGATAVAAPPLPAAVGRELTLDDLQRQWANLRAAYE